jgi:hypothetical protein
MLAVNTHPERSAKHSRPHAAAGLRRPARRSRRTEPEASALDNPTIVTVFMESRGSICHSRCRQPLEYQGTRGGGLEVDFYCLRCVEHVSLPLHVLPRIPQGLPRGGYGPPPRPGSARAGPGGGSGVR